MEEDDRKKEKRKVKKQSKEKYNRQSEEKDDRHSEEKDERQSEEKDGRKKEKRKAKKRKGKNDYNLDYDVDIIYQDPNVHHDQNEASTKEHVKKGTWEDTLKNQNDRTKMTVV